jgi:hypothetical protein
MIFLLIVTFTSMLLAAVMSMVAWRIAADERRRSDARVAALSMEIHDTAPPVPMPIAARSGEARHAAVRRWDEDLELRPGSDAGRVLPAFARGAAARPASQPLFAAAPARSGSRLLVVLAGGALVLGAAASVAMLGTNRFNRTPAAATPVATAEAAAPPLELVALGHERAGDQLTVRGVVRNPASGTAMDRLTAVVLLFTPDGGFLASGRAVVDPPALRPGGESTFAVTMSQAGEVGRYRVSFRADDKLIAHLDRRHES